MRTNPNTEAVNDEFEDEENEFLKQFMNLYADDIEEILELSEILQKTR
jgi:hypothetical protein